MSAKSQGAFSAFEAAAASGASKATYTGAGASVAAGVSGNDWMAILGLLVAVAGFAVNLYYKRKEDRRQQREYDERMRRWGEAP